jgi:hypothetical protein
MLKAYANTAEAGLKQQWIEIKAKWNEAVGQWNANPYYFAGAVVTEVGLAWLESKIRGKLAGGKKGKAKKKRSKRRRGGGGRRRTGPGKAPKKTKGANPSKKGSSANQCDPKRDARLPPKGTPERAAIEQARKKGIKGAIARELTDIRAGGKGSGVWTEAELKKIRKTGKFPADVKWHHDPTVANRPDLAGDPSVVRPVRGGVQGHLEEHGRDWRKPYE